MLEDEILSLTDTERELLKKHLKFYQSLDSGSRTPATQSQEKFVAVCEGKELQSTEHEIAYLKFKKLLAERKKQSGEIAEEGLKVNASPNLNSLDAAKRSAEAYENYGKRASSWKPHIYKDDRNGNRRWT